MVFYDPSIDSYLSLEKKKHINMFSQLKSEAEARYGPKSWTI